MTKPLSIGVIYCAYQTAEYIPMSLTPWVEAKRAALGGDTFTICAISVPFEGFNHEGVEPDGTRDLLGLAAHQGDIDHAIVRDKPMKETDARGAALRWLVEQGVDAVWQVDADEQYTTEDINRIASYVRGNPWTVWFKVSYRNLVFTPKQALVEPFTPARIHRVTAGGYVAAGFYQDNNVYYQSKTHADHHKWDQDYPCMTIPAGVANPLHYTWLNDDRSRRKIKYQLEGRGWPECSFAWDDSKGGLIFNEAYYARRGEPLPEVVDL